MLNPFLLKIKKKSKAQLYLDYKRHHLNMKTKKRRRKDGKRYSMQTVIIKELECYVNIKVDFEARNVIRDKEGYFTLAPHEDNNPKCVRIFKKKKKSFKIHGAKPQAKKRMRQIYNIAHFSFCNCLIKWTEKLVVICLLNEIISH